MCCHWVLDRLLLDYRVRYGFFSTLIAGMTLVFAVYTDNWFQLPTGSLAAPSGITVLGLASQRERGVSGSTVRYTKQRDRFCRIQEFEAFVDAVNETTAVRLQLHRLEDERAEGKRCRTPRTHEECESELSKTMCALALKTVEATEAFMTELIVMGVVLLISMVAAVASRPSMQCATFCLVIAAVVLEWHLWYLESSMTDALAVSLAGLAHLGGPCVPIETAALASALHLLQEPGLTRTVSFQALHVAVTFMLLAAIILFTKELHRVCAPTARGLSGLGGSCGKRLRPFFHKFEKVVIGVSDFDKKNMSYVNKHAHLGRPIRCCSQVPCLNRALTFLRDVRKHQQRAFESTGFMHSLVSDAERHVLESHGVQDQMAQNFLAWRLSVLVLTLTCGVVSVSVKPAMIFAHTALFPDPEQDDWIDPSRMSFANYSRFMVDKAFATVDSKVMEAELWRDLIHYLAEIFSIFMCVLGLSCWIYFGTSRRYVIRGWIVLLFAPFVVTLIPTRSLVDIVAAEHIVNEYLDKLARSFDLDDKLETCQRMVKKDGSISKNMKAFEKMCKKVAEYDNSWAIWLANINLSKAKKVCGKFDRVRNRGRFDGMVKFMNKTCTGLADAFGYGKESGRSHFVSEMRARFFVSLEIYLSARTALGAYTMMVPSALAFGPGFVRASWKLKLLFPLARLPGTLVVLLPAMYCPLLWMTYQIVFQIVGHRLLLAGFVLISFAPMIYSVVGLAFDIQSPVLSRARLSRILRHGRFWRVWVQRFGNILVLVWFLLMEFGIHKFMENESDSPAERAYKDALWRQIRTTKRPAWMEYSRPFTFFIQWCFKFFFTKAAGMDFLIQQIASDFAFERCVEAVVQIPDTDLQADKVPESLRGQPVPERVAETRQLAADRRRIGEALVQMTLDEVPQFSLEGDEKAFPGTLDHPTGDPQSIDYQSGGQSRGMARKSMAAEKVFSQFAPELADYAGFHQVADTPAFLAWAGGPSGPWPSTSPVAMAFPPPPPAGVPHAYNGGGLFPVQQPSHQYAGPSMGYPMAASQAPLVPGSPWNNTWEVEMSPLTHRTPML